MTDKADTWKEVTSKVEALGLKLKLHMEQESSDEADAGGESSTKATVEDFGRKLQDAFESLGAAAKDPAVKADFKDVGLQLKDAIAETFSSVSTEVGDAMKRATKRGEGQADGDDIVDAHASTEDTVDPTDGEA